MRVLEVFLEQLCRGGVEFAMRANELVLYMAEPMLANFELRRGCERAVVPGAWTHVVVDSVDMTSQGCRVFVTRAAL